MLLKWGFILTLILHERSTDKSGYHATNGKGKVIKNIGKLSKYPIHTMSIVKFSSKNKIYGFICARHAKKIFTSYFWKFSFKTLKFVTNIKKQNYNSIMCLWFYTEYYGDGQQKNLTA